VFEPVSSSGRTCNGFQRRAIRTGEYCQRIMELQPEDELTIQRYLLGELGDDDQSAVQDRLLTDESYFKQLLLIENELTHDYVWDALSDHDRERFESYFLAAPERFQKLRAAMALRECVLKSENFEMSGVRPRPDRWWRSFLALSNFRTQLLPISLVAIALIVIVGVLVVLQTTRSRPEESQSQLTPDKPEPSLIGSEANRNGSVDNPAQIPTGELPVPRGPLAPKVEEAKGPVAKKPDTPTRPDDQGNNSRDRGEATVSVVLMPASARGVGRSKSVELPQNAEQLRLQLNVLEARYSSYQVDVSTKDGKTVLSGKMKARQTESGEAVIVNLPASRLNSDDYIVRLSGTPDSGVGLRDVPVKGLERNVSTYQFAIVKKKE
jgi:hypothetical protein